MYLGKTEIIILAFNSYMSPYGIILYVVDTKSLNAPVETTSFGNVNKCRPL